MDLASAVGACLDHPERSGTPCTRCGTFRCGECLSGGLCPQCNEGHGVRPPLPEHTVGFGKRALGRILDMIAGQGAGLVAGVIGGITLAILEAFGVARAGWLERMDHGFGFNFLSGSTASVLGAALTTSLCGASPGKLLLGMRVVQLNGERPTFGSGLIRELWYFIDALFFGFIGKAAMDSSTYKQRHGDDKAGTAVVESKTLSPGQAPSMGRLIVGVGVGLFLQSLVLAAFFVGGAL